MKKHLGGNTDQNLLTGHSLTLLFTKRMLGPQKENCCDHGKSLPNTT